MTPPRELARRLQHMSATGGKAIALWWFVIGVASILGMLLTS